MDGSAVSRPGRVRVLLSSPDLVVGEFVCPPGDELWAVDNDIGDLPHVVWPSTTVEITRARHGAVCADANTVVLYDPRTTYRRRRVSAAGDRSVFVAMAPALLAQLPEQVIRPDGSSFSTGHVLCPGRAWLRKEQFAAAARRQSLDPMRLEELALTAVADAAIGDLPVAGSASVRERVEHVRLLLGDDLAGTLRVTEVADALGVSPFHLARQFRAVTGTSMYAYRQALRVRAAVRDVVDSPHADLSRLAADHGFTSHSHFTATCRRVLGATPSTIRASADGGRGGS